MATKINDPFLTSGIVDPYSAAGQMAAPPEGVRLSDVAKVGGGSVVQAFGGLARGAAEMVRGIAPESGLPGKIAGVADSVSQYGGDLQRSVSKTAAERMAGSTPSGELLSPSTWSLGDAPTASGYGLNFVQGLGSTAPTLAAGALTKGKLAPTAVVAAGTGGGFAAQSEQERVAQMPEAELAKIPRYIELAKTMDAAQARAQLAQEASSSAFKYTAPVSAADALTEVLPFSGAAQRMLGRAVGTGRVARTAAGVATGAAGEAAQEVAENAAQVAGANVATGETRDPMADSFQNAVLGALVGGPINAAAAAVTSPEAAAAQQNALEAEGQPAAAPAAGTEPVAAPQVQEPADAGTEQAPEPQPVPTTVETTVVSPQDGALSKAVAIDAAEQAGTELGPAVVTTTVADEQQLEQQASDAQAADKAAEKEAKKAASTTSTIEPVQQPLQLPAIDQNQAATLVQRGYGQDQLAGLTQAQAADLIDTGEAPAPAARAAVAPAAAAAEPAARPPATTDDIRAALQARAGGIIDTDVIRAVATSLNAPFREVAAVRRALRAEESAAKAAPTESTNNGNEEGSTQEEGIQRGAADGQRGTVPAAVEGAGQEGGTSSGTGPAGSTGQEVGAGKARGRKAGQRKADLPDLTYNEAQEQLDGDVITSSGAPFTIREAADLAAKRTPNGKVIELADGGFVVRTPTESASNEQSGNAAGEVPAANDGGNTGAVGVEGNPDAAGDAGADARPVPAADTAGGDAVRQGGAAITEPGAAAAAPVSRKRTRGEQRDLDAGVPADLIDEAAAASERARAAGAALDAFPKGQMGLTTDEAKSSPEWKAAKAEADKASIAERFANAKVARARKSATPTTETMEQAGAQWTRSTQAERSGILSRAGVAPGMLNRPFDRFGDSAKRKLAQAMSEQAAAVPTAKTEPNGEAEAKPLGRIVRKEDGIIALRRGAGLTIKQATEAWNKIDSKHLKAGTRHRADVEAAIEAARAASDTPTGGPAKTETQRKIDQGFTENLESIRDEGIVKGDTVKFRADGKTITGTVTNVGDEQGVVTVQVGNGGTYAVNGRELVKPDAAPAPDAGTDKLGRPKLPAPRDIKAGKHTYQVKLGYALNVAGNPNSFDVSWSASRKEEVSGGGATAEVLVPVTGNAVPKTVAKKASEWAAEVEKSVAPSTTDASAFSDPTTETPAFKKWFGKSKVVDDNGNPLVVYHGAINTDGGFNIFDRKAGKYASHAKSVNAVGSWFSSNPDDTASYSGSINPERFATGGQTFPVYLSIKQPFRINDLESLGQLWKFQAGGTENLQNGDPDAFRAVLEEQGYDGLVMDAKAVDQFASEGSEYWVAFHPNQIKSAIGNSGAFSADDARIDAAAGIIDRENNGRRFKELADTRAILDEATVTGSVKQLLDGIAAQPGISEDQVLLAKRLSPLAEALGFKLVAPPPGNRLGGGFNNKDDTMFVQQAVPSVALHEALHGVTSGMLTNPSIRKANANVRRASEQLDAVLESVRSSVREAPKGSLPATIQAMVDNPGGPISNTKELLAYGMTDKAFQTYLATVPAPPTSRAVTAWGAFKNAISRLLGLRGGARTALDSVIEATSDLLEFAESNPVAVRLAKMSEAARLTNFAATDPSAFMDVIAQARSGDEGLMSRIKDKVEDLRPSLLGALTLRQIAEISKPYLPAANTYVDDITAMGARRNTLQAEIGDLASKWQDMQSASVRKASAADRAARNTDSDRTVDLMHDSTIAGVDGAEDFKPGTYTLKSSNEQVQLTQDGVDDAISALRAELKTTKQPEARKAIRTDMKGLHAAREREVEREKAYPAIQKRFSELPQAWQDLYREVRDAYSKRADDTLQALLDRVNGLDIDGAEKKALTQRLRAHYESARVEAPYFPLARFGEFWASMTKTDADGVSEPQFIMAETKRERDRAVRQAEAAGYTLKSKGRKIDQIRAQDGASGSFVSEVNNVLSSAGVSESVRDDIYQLYLRTMPELSMRKNFIHRKKVAGYDTDALRAFASNMFHSAHQLAKLEFSPKLDAVLKQAQEQAKDQQDRATDTADSASATLSELKKRHEWVQNPTNAGWAQNLSALNFVFYLGVSPAAALVNLSQTAITTLPSLASRHGWMKSMGMLLDTVKTAASDVRIGDDTGIRRSLKTNDERRAYDDLRAMGAIDVTQSHDLAGLSDTGTEGYSPLQHKVMNVISFLFHKAEVVNREASAIAAYRLARQDGSSHEQAVKQASDTIWETHFDYGSANRARFMQSDAAKVLFAFKQYSQSMTYYLWRNLYQTMKGETPEVRKAAATKLAGTLGMTGVFAGVMGMPLMSVMFGIANAVAAAFGDDDDPFDAETEFRNFIADMLGPTVGRIAQEGLLEGGLEALGISAPEFGSRVSLDELWLRSPDADVEGRDLYLYLLEQAAGPIVGMAGAQIVGAGMIGEALETGNGAAAWRGVEKMLPKAIRDGMKTVRMTTQGANTLRGDPLIEDVDVLQSVYQGMGFSPAEVSRQYQVNASMREYEKYVTSRRSGLIDAYALGIRENDTEMQAKALEKIRSFNQKYPALAITTGTLRRSLKSRQSYSERSINGMVRNPKLADLTKDAGRFGGEPEAE